MSSVSDVLAYANYKIAEFTIDDVPLSNTGQYAGAPVAFSMFNLTENMKQSLSSVDSTVGNGIDIIKVGGHFTVTMATTVDDDHRMNDIIAYALAQKKGSSPTLPVDYWDADALGKPYAPMVFPNFNFLTRWTTIHEDTIYLDYNSNRAAKVSIPPISRDNFPFQRIMFEKPPANSDTLKETSTGNIYFLLLSQSSFVPPGNVARTRANGFFEIWYDDQ